MWKSVEVRERDCKNAKVRGSPRKGLQEHVFCFKTAIEDFKHESGKLHVIFFDIADAFGSLEHKIMLQEMLKLGIPQHYTEIIKDTYNGSTFKVRTSDGETKPINRERGIIQGCPWSVYGFLIGIDKWIRWLDDPNQLNHDKTNSSSRIRR